MGESTTTSFIYIHNRSNKDISGITYTIRDNSESGNSSLDYESCHYIAAGKSCALKFTTPNISSSENQGSMQITASYVVESNNIGQFNRIINYKKINSPLESGIIFNSGVEIFGSNDSTDYATLYIYGSGTNSTYQISDMTSSNSKVIFTQGNIPGQLIKSNEVKPVEVVTSITTNNFISELTVFSNNYTLESTSYTSKTIASIILLNGPKLTSGVVPLVDSAVESPEGKLFIVNTGSESANISDIDLPTNITEITESDSCTTAKSLNSYTSCSIHFNTPQGGSGEGNITVTYNDESSINYNLIQPIQWFNSKDAELLMNANPDSINFDISSSGETTITVTNIGGYNLTNISVPKPTTTGHAIVVESNLECSAGGTNLPIGGYCTYHVYTTNNYVESGTINLGISGIYNNAQPESYNNTIKVNYISYGGSPNLTMDVDPDPMYFNINTSKTAKVTITNTGNYNFTNVSSLAPVLITGTANFSTSSLQCHAGESLLPIGESCTYNVSLSQNKIDTGSIKLAIVGYYNGNENFNQTEILDYTTVIGSVVYVINETSNTISQFTMNESTGILIPNSNINAPDDMPQPQSIAIDPSGRFAYSTAYGGFYHSVAAYNINQTTGDLTFLNKTGTEVLSRGIAITPDGKYAYVAHDKIQFPTDSLDVQGFSINQNNGSISEFNIYQGSKTANMAAISHRSGKNFLFVTDDYEGLVLGYYILKLNHFTKLATL